MTTENFYDNLSYQSQVNKHFTAACAYGVKCPKKGNCKFAHSLLEFKESDCYYGENCNNPNCFKKHQSHQSSKTELWLKAIKICCETPSQNYPNHYKIFTQKEFPKINPKTQQTTFSEVVKSTTTLKTSTPTPTHSPKLLRPTLWGDMDDDTVQIHLNPPKQKEISDQFEGTKKPTIFKISVETGTDISKIVEALSDARIDLKAIEMM